MQEAQETQVKSLACEDPLEEETATHSNIDWKIPTDKGAWRATVHEVGQDWAHTQPAVSSWNWFQMSQLLLHKPSAQISPVFTLLSENNF